MQTEATHAQNLLTIETIVLFMSIAAVVSIFSNRIKLPYTIALVLVGLILSFFHALEPIHLTEDLVLFIFLPALLFEAAWHLDFKYFKINGLAIMSLATFGLILAISIIGFGLNAFLGLPLLTALLFGAMIASTDPVSVVAIMKKMQLDHRLAAVIEGESLCNDGTAVVIFKMLLALILMGSTFEAVPLQEVVVGGIGQFLVVAVGATIVGAVVGGFFSFLTSKFDEPILELTFTTIVAYSAFLLAEHIQVPGIIPHIHLSGVIATVTAGLIMGNVAREKGMSASTVITVESFWEYAAFFVNSLIFLMIGLEMQIDFLLSQWAPILLAFVLVLTGRAAAVYLTTPLANQKMSAVIERTWQHVLVWGGLRGALAMALALSLPRGFEGRDMLIAMVFGVVLLSLIVQGLSMPALLKKLGLGIEVPEILKEYQHIRAKLLTAKRAKSLLSHQLDEGLVSKAVAKTINKELDEEIETAESDISDLHVSNQLLQHEATIEINRQLLSERKAAVSDLIHHGIISPEVGRELSITFDSEMSALGAPSEESH